MATNMFAQFSNIEGECEDKPHEKWCEITSLQQGFTNETTPHLPDVRPAPVHERGKHKVVSIKKVIDKASIGLMEACWNGTTVDTVLIECFRTGLGLDDENQPIKYFSIKLENVIIKKFKYNVDEGKLISEDLDLIAGKESYEYRQMLKRTGYAVRGGMVSIELGQGDHDGSPNIPRNKEAQTDTEEENTPTNE